MSDFNSPQRPAASALNRALAGGGLELPRVDINSPPQSGFRLSTGLPPLTELQQVLKHAKDTSKAVERMENALADANEEVRRLGDEFGAKFSYLADTYGNMEELVKAEVERAVGVGSELALQLKQQKVVNEQTKGRLSASKAKLTDMRAKYEEVKKEFEAHRSWHNKHNKPRLVKLAVDPDRRKANFSDSESDAEAAKKEFKQAKKAAKKAEEAKGEAEAAAKAAAKAAKAAKDAEAKRRDRERKRQREAEEQQAVEAALEEDEEDEVEREEGAEDIKEYDDEDEEEEDEVVEVAAKKAKHAQ
jgi:hypothetical protein